jgi:hypothetical protein
MGRAKGIDMLYSVALSRRRSNGVVARPGRAAAACQWTHGVNKRPSTDTSTGRSGPIMTLLCK